MKVAFLIRTFDVGGSERQLLALARGLVERDHEVLVVVVRQGTLVPELRRAGANVVEGSYGLRSLRRFRPDALHGYLAFANILATSYRLVLPRTRIVLGVRGVHPERDPVDHRVRALYRTEALVSRFAHATIANSEAGAEAAVARGFPGGRMHIVQNGIDTAGLRRDPVAGKQLRSEWGVTDGEVLIGRVANFRPTKDYDTFLRAAAIAARVRPELRFAVVGDGPDRPALEELARRLELDGRLVWAGTTRDIGSVMSAFDLMVSSSRWESFPNVVAEAMACGVPCAVTDTGDSARIVGDTGTLAPPGEPELLATATLELVERLVREGDQLRAAARGRIEENFSVAGLVTRTERILLELAAG